MSARFTGRRALVTGGSAGIGRAIAAGLAGEGARVAIAARTPGPLKIAAREIGAAAALAADLSTPEAAYRLAEQTTEQLGGLDILILASGSHLTGRIQDLGSNAFHDLMEANLFGPVALVKALLPALIKTRGDILFVNSSVTTAANTGGRVYFAAGNHALQAFADGLRAEVNEQGVRVTSLFPGSTATPRQAQLHRDARKAYSPERILQPRDLAEIVLSVLSLPASAEMTDLYVRPRYKA